MRGTKKPNGALIAGRMFPDRLVGSSLDLQLVQKNTIATYSERKFSKQALYTEVDR